MREPTEDIRHWLRVHALSLTVVQGVSPCELLLELDVARVLTTDTPPNHLAQAQREQLVLGADAASILLRLLLDAGVVPKDVKTETTPGH